MEKELPPEEVELTARLKALIEATEGKVPAVAQRAGIPVKTIYNWISGSNADKVLALARICAACGTTIDALLAGGLIAKSGFMEPDPADVCLVPVLDVVASAGHGAENASEAIVGHFPFPTEFFRKLRINPANVRALKSKGDSMFPTIPDDRWVMVNTGDRDISRTNIFLLRTPDGLRLKRVHRAVDGTITLISDNKEFYPPETLSRVDAEATKAIGHAFWVEKLI